MIILHPWSSKGSHRKKETWDFLYTARDEYNVIDENVDAPMAYVDFMKAYWGIDDLIVLEDDKVPTLQDLEEMVACPRPACVFPYPVSFWRQTDMSLWTHNFPYGMGFAKFSKAIQDATPPCDWKVEDPKKPGWGIDGQIQKAVIQKSGPIHVHPRWIKHNHRPTKFQWVIALARGH